MPKSQAAFISDNHNIEQIYTSEQRAELAALADFRPAVLNARNFDSEDVSGLEYLFSTWGMPALTPEQIAKMPKLRGVFYAAGATDSFAMPFLEKGIKVVSAWKANAVPVAEFTVAQIILSMKNYFQFPRIMSGAEGPNNRSKVQVGPGCYGDTVALIGDGMIASLVKEKLKAYDLNVLTVSSFPEKRTVSLDEAFSKAFVVSNHLFNHPSNQGVLTEKLFASMRQNATFINTGRGAQVDEPGLIAALRKRPDLTALLDVTWPEPPAAESPLWTLPNVFLTPHIAGSLNDEVHRMAAYVIDDFKRFLDGKPLEYEVKIEHLQQK